MIKEAMFPYTRAWIILGPILHMLGLKKYLEAPSYFVGEETRKSHNSGLFKSNAWTDTYNSSYIQFRNLIHEVGVPGVCSEESTSGQRIL